MVHALQEIHRVLARGGVLIDLRPVEERWPVEVVSASACVAAGRLIDLPEALADDEAASRALSEVEMRGLFVREAEESFPYFYTWDRPSEMKEFMETEWEGFEKLDEEVLRAVQSRWASGGAEALVRVRVKMLITKWKKSQ